MAGETMAGETPTLQESTINQFYLSFQQKRIFDSINIFSYYKEHQILNRGPNISQRFMNGLLTAIPAGVTAFCATNLDDILILVLFFTQLGSDLRCRHIIAGQYLGFGALVLISLPSFFSSLILPSSWLGLLGIIPLAIGLNRLLNEEGEKSVEGLNPSSSFDSPYSYLIAPQTYAVAAITFANGGDNVSIYIPLFANSSWEELLIIVGEFSLLVGVWCYSAYRLTKLSAIANTLTRYGNRLVPFVLIALGIFILIDSHTLENRGLAVLTWMIAGLGLWEFLPWGNPKKVE